MHHFPESYLIFLSGLGWMVVAWTAVPEVIGRRAMWWLIAFGLCIALGEGIHSTLLKYDFDQPGFAESKLALLYQIATHAFLLEFLRRVPRPAAQPVIGRWLHSFTVAAAIVVMLGRAPLALACVRLFAVGVLAATAREFWRIAPPGDPRRRGLLLAGVGFALLAGAKLLGGSFGPPPDSTGFALLAILRATAPWLVCLGATEAFLALLGTRSHAARFFFFCLALTPFFTPLLERQVMPRVAAGARARVVRVAGENTAGFDPAAISRLAAGTATAADRAGIDTQLAGFRAWHIAPERTYLWTLRDGVVVPLAGAPGELHRDTTAAELTAATTPAPFLREPLSDGWSDWLSANGPFPGTTHTVWLALEYRAREWARLMESIHYTLAAPLAIFAVFLTVGIVLTWRRALEDRRIASLHDAETTSQAKSEFLSFLSHELRTPLQTVLGRTELLRRETPAATRHADAIETQGRLLLRLVTDLLDLGTIEAGKLKLQPASFALRPLLASLEETHGPIAAAKGLTLDLVVSPEVPDTLVGDEGRLRQILGNLLSNAVKYTARGSVMLCVSSRKLHGEQRTEDGEQTNLATAPRPPSSDICPLLFTVTDTGPGLPPEKISQLFTLFTRLDAGGSFTREGTGVGLALVRRLCRLMGGTVTAANRPEGGATFVVDLAFPLGETIPVTRLVRGGTARPITPADLSAPNPLHRRILIAEDNTAAREFLLEALRALGHDVEAVADGQAALEAARARPFAAALLDINLPLLDGIALARVLRAEQPALRLIGCSADVFDATRDAALAAGMAEFLTKPVSLAELARAFGPPAPLSTASDDVFSRLRAAGQLARTREVWTAEWPLIRAKLEAAVAASEAATIARHTHYLRSTALLLGDTALADAIRALADAAHAGDWPATRTRLDELIARAGR